jgi:iron complex outermembrane receptor protein
MRCWYTQRRGSWDFIRLRSLVVLLLSVLLGALDAPVRAESAADRAGAVQEIAGRVLSRGQNPVEHARVSLSGIPGAVFSDQTGRFEVADVTLPTTLIIEHPRFATAKVEVTGGSSIGGKGAGSATATDLVIVLEAKQEVYETIAVSANRGQQNFAPVSVASTVVEPGEAAAPVSTVGQLLAETAAVSENGQGGIFQTFSIRGVSRQRVLTLVSGMRIVGDRRAGVSASFADPLVLGSIDVVRGPSSTYYGSGALGGVVQLFPRHFDRLTVAAGYESQGDERSLLVAGGDASTSWGLSIRDAESSETPAGDEIYSQFRLTSGSFRHLWERGGLGLEVSVLGSYATDIGKSNTDFPTRTTTYPEERHLVVRFALQRPAVWSFEAALHPNSLETRVIEESVAGSELDNDAVDINLSWQRRIHGSRIGALRLGVDYFGRRGVSALERQFNLANEIGGGALRPDLVQKTLENGEEDELGLFGAWEWNRGPAVIIVGGRAAWQRQQNARTESADDKTATAFTGVVVPVGGGFELAVNAGTGLRFPSLSERFFSGATGRGFVVGNADLEPERSFNLDLGMRFYGKSLFVAGYLFRNEIDDYIERVEVEPERLTFVNLSSGRIEGLETEGLLQLTKDWSMTFGGHLFNGRDSAGEPLADVPANRFYLGVLGQRSSWSWRLRWEARAAKDDPGSGEKAIPAADLLTGSIEYEVRSGLMIQMALRNALDEEYFSSADRKVPLAPGRSVSVGLRWTRSGD